MPDSVCQSVRQRLGFVFKYLPKRIAKHYFHAHEVEEISAATFHEAKSGEGRVDVYLDKLNREDVWEWVRLPEAIKIEGQRDITHSWARTESKIIDDDEFDDDDD